MESGAGWGPTRDSVPPTAEVMDGRCFKSTGALTLQQEQQWLVNEGCSQFHARQERQELGLGGAQSK